MTAFSRVRLLGSAVWIAGALAMAGAAGADPIPPGWLQNQHEACMKTCAAHGTDAAACGRYCDCAGQQTESSITMEEYMEADQAMKDGKQPTQDYMSKIRDITASCQAKAK